jgi:Collagen triple helix repeat (20 copies)
MFSAIRRRLHLSPATAIASLALVFAMTGGAYAASKYVITSTKQISPKVLKSLQGKAGPAGKNGVNGTNGAAGAQGTAGAQGPKGETGATGSDGTGVTSAESKTKIGSCKEGGSEFKAASGTTYACNGEKGKEGKEGTFGGQALPSGKTLTGLYSGTGYGEAAEDAHALASTSFALPLEKELEGIHVHYIKEGEEPLPTGCSGSVHAPGAAPGNLCVFAEDEVNVAAGGGGQAHIEPSTFGFNVIATNAAKGQVLLAGSWAVTAE